MFPMCNIRIPKFIYIEDFPNPKRLCLNFETICYTRPEMIRCIYNMLVWCIIQNLRYFNSNKRCTLGDPEYLKRKKIYCNTCQDAGLIQRSGIMKSKSFMSILSDPTILTKNFHRLICFDEKNTHKWKWE